MKRKVLSAIVLLVCFNLKAQNKLESTGYAGVGISSPQHLMHINGNHGNTRLLLHSTGGGEETRFADLMLWASEPGLTYSGVGIGNNVINLSTSPYLTRISNERGASYMRLLEENIMFNVITKSGNNINALNINNTGYVGIGTLSPGAKLDINGVVRVSNGGTDKKIEFLRTGGNTFSLEHDSNRLYFYNSTTAKPILAMSNNMNVGIGTVSPESNLQIGSSTANGLIMLGGGKGYSSIGSTRSDGGLVLGKNIYARYLDASDNLIARVGVNSGAGFAGIKIGQYGVIDFFAKSGNVIGDEVANTNETSRIRVSSNGNIGIGTTTPGAKQEIYVKSGGPGVNALRLNTGFIGGNSVDINPYISGYSNDGLEISLAGIRRFVINPKGNVGIGTEDTGIHKLAVEGSIGARKIKVQATGWADFVFEKEYNLPTLKEVETHIKEKGHLKDIPSAAKVKKDGFFLGEMDAKLLQKIEELTLYTIQQEKKLKAQDRELKKLQGLSARLEKLEKLLEQKN